MWLISNTLAIASHFSIRTWSTYGTWILIWTTTWQNQQTDCAPSEVSDQPGQPPSLIRVFAVRMKKAGVLSYPLSAQRRLIRLGGFPGWSESSSFVGLVMSRLISHQNLLQSRKSALLFTEEIRTLVRLECCGTSPGDRLYFKITMGLDTGLWKGPHCFILFHKISYHTKVDMFSFFSLSAQWHSGLILLKIIDFLFFFYSSLYVFRYFNTKDKGL